jgi:predicted nucleic acid-binding protein
LTDVVLDASVVAAWYLRGQATAGADQLLREAPNLQFAVPHIFPSELANFLLVAERDRRITANRSREVLDDLAGYEVSVRDAPPIGQVGALLALARNEGLSAYDATYLDLAAREGLILASRDSALLRAASRRGVQVRDVRS